MELVVHLASVVQQHPWVVGRTEQDIDVPRSSVHEGSMPFSFTVPCVPSISFFIYSF